MISLEELKKDVESLVQENSILKERIFVLETEARAVCLRDIVTPQTEPPQLLAPPPPLVYTAQQVDPPPTAKRKAKKGLSFLDKVLQVEKVPKSNKRRKLDDPSANGPRHTRKRIHTLGDYFVIPRSHFVPGHQHVLPTNGVQRLAHCIKLASQLGYDKTAAFLEFTTANDITRYAQTILFQVNWLAVGTACSFHNDSTFSFSCRTIRRDAT